MEVALEQQTGARPGLATEAFRHLPADLHQFMRRLHAGPLIPGEAPERGFFCHVETGRLEEVAAD